MEMANGTKMTIKAMVSSLMPNTEPNKLNMTMMATISRLFTPTARKNLCFCILCVLSKNR